MSCVAFSWMKAEEAAIHRSLYEGGCGETCFFVVPAVTSSVLGQHFPINLRVIDHRGSLMHAFFLLLGGFSAQFRQKNDPKE